MGVGCGVQVGSGVQVGTVGRGGPLSAGSGVAVTITTCGVCEANSQAVNADSNRKISRIPAQGGERLIEFLQGCLDWREPGGVASPDSRWLAGRVRGCRG